MCANLLVQQDQILLSLTQAAIHHSGINNNNNNHNNNVNNDNHNNELLQPDQHMKRRVVGECLKVLFNLTSHAHRPALATVLTPEQQQQFEECIVYLLSLGTQAVDKVQQEAEWSMWIEERKQHLQQMKTEDDDNRILYEEQQQQLQQQAQQQQQQQEERKDPSLFTLEQLKHDAAYLLMYLPQHLSPQLAQRPAALQGLYDITASDITRNVARASHVVPILTVLKGVVEHSEVSCEYFQRMIFRHLSLLSSSSKSNNMRATESFSFDLKWNPIRKFLLDNITTADGNLKTSIEEFLWLLCHSESSEYIAQVGFGNAAGLLAAKGLPGFAYLKEQAIDIDQLIQSGKKL